MENTQAPFLLKEAQALLEVAAKELLRPQNDTVSYAACQCVKQSIRSFLRYYLLIHDIKVDNHHSIEEMIHRCIRLDNRFKDIDWSQVTCKQKEEKSTHPCYCLITDKVKCCYFVARDIRDIVLSKQK